MKQQDHFVFFWRPQEENGYLGNWFLRDFELDGTRFNCSEQAMMYKKAMLMGDPKTAAIILKEDQPAKHKKLGQSVAPWDEKKWLENREKIMFDSCRAKFLAAPDLLEQLLATGDACLVEASPMDKIWGIGLAKDHPDASKPKNWKGLNLLGKVLMEVREDLRQTQRKA
jgi:ribA/ribD-fused uncharacterized protein